MAEIPECRGNCYSASYKRYIASLEAALKEKENQLANARQCANDRIAEIERLETQLTEARAEIEKLSAWKDEHPVSVSALAEITTNFALMKHRAEVAEARLSAYEKPVTDHEAEDALNGYYENGGHDVHRQVKGMQVAFARIIASRGKQ